MNRIKSIIKVLSKVVELLKLNYFIIKKNLLQTENPKKVLEVINLYINLEKDSYKQTIKMNRNINKSAEILQVLTEDYLSLNSNVTLVQLLTVLKEEFIKRED